MIRALLREPQMMCFTRWLSAHGTWLNGNEAKVILIAKRRGFMLARS
jgi:hypothetical protein